MNDDLRQATKLMSTGALAEYELLTLLMEECAEVQQAAAKVMRFGPVAWHPLDDTREGNAVALMREVGDVYAAVALLSRSPRPDGGAPLLDAARVEEFARDKLQRHLGGKTPLAFPPMVNGESEPASKLGDMKRVLMSAIIDLEEGQAELCYKRLRQALDRVMEVPVV